MKISNDVIKWIDNILTAEMSWISKVGVITVPIVPFYDYDNGQIIITSSLAYSNKVRSILKNPKVSLLFSNPQGLPQISSFLLQGHASIDYQNLYEWKNILEKQPDNHKTKTLRRKSQQLEDRMRFKPIKMIFDEYMQRILIKITPCKIFHFGVIKNPDTRLQFFNHVFSFVDNSGFPSSMPLTKKPIKKKDCYEIHRNIELTRDKQKSCLLLYHHDNFYNKLKQETIIGTLSKLPTYLMISNERSYTLYGGLRGYLNYFIHGKKIANSFKNEFFF